MLRLKDEIERIFRATYAQKLEDTLKSLLSAGSSTLPVYFEDGVPKAITFGSPAKDQILSWNGSAYSWINKPAANVSTSAVLASAADGKQQISTNTSNPYYNLLEGTNIARSIQFKAGTNMEITTTVAGVITFNATNTWQAYVAPTENAEGTAGYITPPTYGNINKFLRGDGTWQTPTDTKYKLTLNNTEKGTSRGTSLGTIYAPESAGTGFLKGTAGQNGAITWSWDNSTYNNYSLPTASNTTKGGVKTGAAIESTTGYTAVHIKEGVIYYKDTNTWTAWVGATQSTNGTAGYMPAPTSALRNQFLRGDGSWVSLNNYSLPAATTSALGGIIISNTLSTAVTLTSSNGATTDRYYGVLIDKNNKAFVNIPWEANTHYTATLILGGNTSTANVTSDTINAATYLNIIENSAKSGGVLITGSGGTTVKAKNGILTITSPSLGTGSTNAAKGNHDHTLSIATDEGTNEVSLAANTKYKLTAGGKTLIFTTPSDNNTWKPANTSQEGYVPKLALASTATIATLTTEYVLTYISGTETAPVWRKLPANAFKNTWTAADSSNAGYVPKSVKGKFLHAHASTGALEWVDDRYEANTDKTGVKKGTAGTTTTTGLVIANSASGLIMEGGEKQFKVGDGTNSFTIPLSVSSLNVIRSIGGDDHAKALQTEFTNNYSSIPRNSLVNYYSSAYSNGSQYFGYFLSGYNSNPYGGFFVAHYNSCYYIGILDGTFTQLTIATSSNISDKDVTIGTSSTTIATIAGVNITAKIGSYAASNHTHALSLATDTGTSSISLSANTKYKLTAGGETLIFTTPSDNNTWKQNTATLEGYVTAPGSNVNGKVWMTGSDGTPSWQNANNHSHSYLPLSGGTMTGNITFSGDNNINWTRNTDSASISFKNTGDGDTDSYMNFVTGDNGNEYFRFSHTSGGTNTEWFSIKSDGARVQGTKVSLEGHKHAYTDLTGSSTTADLAIVSTGTANGWTLKTLGSNAFNSTSFITISDILDSIYNPSTDVDLNDRKGSKFYATSWSYSNHSYILNQPDGDRANTAATVISIPGAYPWLIYRNYSNNNYYVRGYYSGTGWTGWKRIALTGEAPTAHKHPYSDITGSTTTADQVIISNGTANGWILKTLGSNAFSSDSYSLSTHTHNYAGSPSAGGPANKLASTDKRSKYPNEVIPNYAEAAMTFMLMSTLGISNHGVYADVLSMSSYLDSSGGKENAIIFAKNNKSVWHTQFEVKSTDSWGTPYLFADSNNSSVSGGGNSLGSSITIKICETEKTLTIPSTVDWTLLTSVPSTFTPSAHNHSYLVGGYNTSSNQQGNGTLYYAYHIAANTSGTPATTDNSNSIITINRHEGNYYSQIGFGSDGRIKYRSYSSQSISDNVTKTWNVLAYKSEIPTDYVNFVGVTDDTTNHANQLRYVVGTNSTYFTVPYATNADTVDGKHASTLLHYDGYYSIPGNNINSSTKLWSKIGSMTFTGSWQQCGASLTFYEWESRRMMGELKFNIRTKASKSTAGATIVWMNLTNKDFESSFIICRTGDGTYDIYFEYPASSYNNVRFYIISQYDDGYLTWQNGSALTSTEPTYVNERFVSSLTSWVGNADLATTASKWQTERTLTIGNTGKSVDGSGDVTWTLAEIGAQAAGSYSSSSHTHSVKINGSTKTIAASNGTTVDLGNYLPNNGGWMPSTMTDLGAIYQWGMRGYKSDGTVNASYMGWAATNSDMHVYTDGKFWQREGTYYCLDNGNTYVSSGKGVINGTTITQVNNADTVDGYHAGVQNGQVSIFVPWPSASTMKSEGFLTSDYGTSEYGYPDEIYLQAICKWAIAHYTNLGDVTLIGSIAPNSSGTVIMHLYSSSGKDSTTLLPRYCGSTYQTLGGQIYEFGCHNYTWYYRKIRAGAADSATSAGSCTGNAATASNMAYTGLTGSGTTANQAIVSSGTANGWTLKTLGSRAFDSTDYLPISGGTITGDLTIGSSSKLKNLQVNGYGKFGGGGLQYPIRITRAYNDSVDFLIGSKAASGNDALDFRLSNSASGGGNEVYIDLIHSGGGVNIYPSLSVDGDVQANKFIKKDGTSSQFLKADGSVDSSTYLTSLPSHDHYRIYNTTGKTPSTAFESTYLRWYALINKTSGDPAYAGDNYGFPASSNANGILWLGTHPYASNDANKPYGGLIGVSSNGRLYYRFTAGSAPATTANGGSWNRIAWSSEIPTTMAWGSITSKPDTATRWPTWDEVTSKPSSFTPSSHTHNMNDIKWPGGHNLTTSATANGQEWSIDCTPGSYTGTYWHVWRATTSGINVSGTMLKVDCDTGKVSAPYGFVGNLSGNATTATTATNLSANPSLQAGTTNTNAITITAGNKTSSEFTIPYATSAGDSSKFSGLSLNRFVYSVGSGALGTSEATGTSDSLDRTLFWRDNSKGAIGVFVSHSGSSAYGWEIHTGYSDTSDFVGRVKSNGTWGSKRTFITSANIGSQSVSYATSSGTATKLGTDAGDSTTPVYFSGGKPVACTSYSSASVDNAKRILSGSYTATNNTVAGHKAGLINWMDSTKAGIGNYVSVSASIIGQWNNDSATYYDSSSYAFMKIGGSYNSSTYGQWLLSSYGTTRVGYVGRTGDNWTTLRWFIDTDGNQTINGNLTATTFIGNLTGNVTGNCSGSSGSCTGNAATATYATSAGSATYASSYLANRKSIGSSSTTHATALLNYFNDNKSTIPRNCLTANFSSSYGNGSLYFGYFLSGYDSTPYGGFYVCHYDTPYYVGIGQGTYTQQQIITSSSIGSQSVSYATTATNLTNTPSVQAGTSNSNNITITAGEKTSAEFTIPYAITSGTASMALYLNTNANAKVMHKEINSTTASYKYHVILLVAVQRSTNQSAYNYLDGHFFLYKTGGNVYDVVDVNLNQVYNSLEYNITCYGQNGTYTLCRCTYNGIQYYALKCPYHANPFTNIIFDGSVRSDWDTNELSLPFDIAYKTDAYGSTAAVINNSEINNSLTNTLTTSVVTSVNFRKNIFPAGIIVNSIAKSGSTSSKVLLGDGSDKNLSDFIGSLNWDSTNKKIQYKKIGDSSWTDLADISAAWTDLNVKQTSNSDNSDKNLALCTVSTSGNSAGLLYNSNIKANPNTGVITAKGFKNSSSSDSNVLLGGGGTKPLNNMQVCGTISAVIGANSMAALDISKTFIYATINANATLGVSANMTVGQVLTVLVDNTGSSAITITIPALASPVSTTGPNWYSLDGYSLTIPSGNKYEISILCFKVATSGSSNVAPYYLVSAKSQ